MVQPPELVVNTDQQRNDIVSPLGTHLLDGGREIARSPAGLGNDFRSRNHDSSISHATNELNWPSFRYHYTLPDGVGVSQGKKPQRFCFELSNSRYLGVRGFVEVDWEN